MGALILGCVSLVIVYNAESMDGTAAGLLLIYSMSFGEVITFIARTHADVSASCGLHFLLHCLIFFVVSNRFK